MVNKAGIVYDFAFVNRITTTNLIENSNYWYIYPDYGNDFLGNKLFKFLFFKNDFEKDLCIELTKDNIDSQLKKEADLLDDFIQKNKKYLDEYFDFIGNSKVIYSYYKYSYFEKLPDEIEKDEEYISSKFSEIKNK